MGSRFNYTGSERAFLDSKYGRSELESIAKNVKGNFDEFVEELKKEDNRITKNKVNTYFRVLGFKKGFDEWYKMDIFVDLDSPVEGEIFTLLDFLYESKELEYAVVNEAIDYDSMRKVAGNNHRIRVSNIADDLSELYGFKIVTKDLNDCIKIKKRGCKSFRAWAGDDVLSKYDEEGVNWANSREGPPRKGYRRSIPLHIERLQKARNNK